jgi:hypothetical protein
LNGQAVLGACYCGHGRYKIVNEGLHDYINECKADSQEVLLTALQVMLGITGVLLLVNYFGAGSHTVVFHSLDTLQIIALLATIDV